MKASGSDVGEQRGMLPHEMWNSYCKRKDWLFNCFGLDLSVPQTITHRSTQFCPIGHFLFAKSLFGVIFLSVCILSFQILSGWF